MADVLFDPYLISTKEARMRGFGSADSQDNMEDKAAEGKTRSIAVSGGPAHVLMRDL